MIALLAITLKDEVLERIRRNFADAIRELQQSVGMQMTVIEGVTLQDGVTTPIPHGRGRAVRVFVSPVRGASSNGRIEEIRDGSYRRESYVALKATGFTAAVTVDLAVI